MADSPVREEAARLLANATPGPWHWRGNSDGLVELTTSRNGGERIISAHRSEPCIVETSSGIDLTTGACDECKRRFEMPDSEAAFDGYRCPKDENLGTVWLWDRNGGGPWAGFIRPANHWAVQEVTYRTDVARLDHPDADFIAAAPTLVADLLALTASDRSVVEDDAEHFIIEIGTSDSEMWAGCDCGWDHREGLGDPQNAETPVDLYGEHMREVGQRERAASDRSEIEQLRALVLFLGTRHTVDFTDAGWNMTHPVTCRFIPGGLKNCPVNAGALYEWDDPPVEELGEYVVDLDSEGSIEVGERVEHPEPPAELWATLRAVLDEVPT